jgi:hypothetical protein
MAEINAVLQSGITSTTVDGTTHVVSHDTLREERAEIRRALGITRKKRMAYRVNLNGR